jgi:hypothetical protein
MMMQAAFSRRGVLAGGIALGLIGCSRTSDAQAQPDGQDGQGRRQASSMVRQADGEALSLITAARNQIGVTRSYDPGYSRLAYPGGDVSRERGVCTDVVVRAYRDALGIDLQRAVHEDMAAHFSAYPRNWGLRRPDRNIDHRRVPNLARFWKRAGAELTLPGAVSDWRPGDLFSSLVGANLPHTGIISDRVSPAGVPLVIHNIGRGAQEEELTVAGRMIGRYRWRV